MGKKIHESRKYCNKYAPEIMAILRNIEAGEVDEDEELTEAAKECTGLPKGRGDLYSHIYFFPSEGHFIGAGFW